MAKSEYKIQLTDDQWRQKMSNKAYRMLDKQGAKSIGLRHCDHGAALEFVADGS